MPLRTRIKEIQPRTPYVVSRDARLMEIVSLMLEHKIIGVGVVDEEDTLLGVVSVDELLEHKATPAHLMYMLRNHSPYKVMEEFRREQEKTHALTAGELMRSDYPVIEEEETVGNAITMFFTEKVAFLPVVREGKMVGVVTRFDLLKTLFEKASPGFEEPPPED